MSRSSHGDPSKVTPELVDRYFDLATRASNRAALQARVSQCGALASEAPVSAITQLSLILWGARDRLIPLAAVQRWV